MPVYIVAWCDGSSVWSGTDLDDAREYIADMVGDGFADAWFGALHGSDAAADVVVAGPIAHLEGCDLRILRVLLPVGLANILNECPSGTWPTAPGRS